MPSRILDIPHIINAIADYLTPRERTVALRVCRTWYDLFLPIVWSTLVLNTRHQHNAFQSTRGHKVVVTNQHLVRTLDANTITLNLLLSDGEWLFPHLHTVRIDWTHLPASDRLHDHLCAFVQVHPLLHTVDIQVRDLRPSTLDLWIEILGSLEQLRNVRFSLNVPLSPIQIRRILEACAKRVIVLDLEFRKNNIYPPRALDAQNAAAQAMAHFPETRLQELRIGLAMLALDTSFLGPLLVRSPRLRALSLALSSRGVPQGLAMVVRDHCPELTRLAVKHHGTEDKTTELLLGAFEHGLERLTVQCRTIDPSSFVAAMTAPQMLHRLTSLCIRASLTPVAMATLAQQCCHLTELQANVLAPEFDNEKATHSSPWPGDELDHVWLEDDLSGLERIQWGCTKLRRLNLQMLHPGTFGWNASEDNGLLDRFEDYFLVQIGSLTALQELTLSRPGHRRHGLDGLKRLDRLRALKVVDVRIAFAKLGVDEAKWIASHWGSLIEIRIPADAADVLQEWKPWIQCLDRPLS